MPSVENEQKIKALSEEVEKWKKKYEDLEINRASCCVQQEEDLYLCRQQIKELQHMGQDLMHRLNESVSAEELNILVESQRDEWAKQRILKLARDYEEACESRDHYHKLVLRSHIQ